MSDIKLGLHPKMPMAQYLSMPAFSSGLGQTLLTKSALHAWVDSPWNPDRERDDSGIADIGTFAHACLLEGGTDALVVVDAADWRTNAAKAERDAARAAGKLPILAHKVAEVEAMVEAAKAYLDSSELAGLFDTGAAEQTVVFESNGVLCKARPDWLTEDRRICLSYKTTPGSANPDAWIRTQLPGYDMAAVLYERGIKAATGAQDVRVVHLIQEQSSPYSCSLIALSPAWQAMAEQKLNLALAGWEACLSANKFPAYPTRIAWAEPKPWMLAEVEEKQGNDSDGIPYDVSKIWEKP